ncbi:hypothetical protein ADIARSV_2639 [Arcticibacter svalbardensis MN12-7]|uniref:Uncharacterized protein n=1 Tax=Arcticibacter svalbardensis MN12-7 TaxID=1150600 RepID=R9GRB2_9SPHI|nr:DUF6266 family protein [Arcticibacter svalbardensis]EOR94223.1 hypothetical protein ADIARSV_2639 [Arcticibacter svalbardensis MN12-7]
MMRTIKNGANGAFSGKVGSVVGSNWRDVDYIRGLSKRSTKKPTEKQSQARRNFGLLSEFLGSLRAVIDQGFKHEDTRRATALNLAIQANYQVFENVQADALPDYAKVILSKGRLVGKPAGCNLSSAGAGVMRITWEMYSNSALERGVDQATIVLYSPSLKESLILSDQYLRQDQMAEIHLPGSWADQNLCVYMFMTSMEDQNSDSVFVGFFTN